ncbi:DUF2169 domain-containing protein [Sorangium sp. So ce1099]|uniref:DUF2169 domain-containing protein n=1 Tax=Sorangium sp. So ce1099 TaxID=3133331 RepID=UPI003F609672
MDVVCQGFLRASSLVWRLRPDAWALTVACRAHFELAPGESPMTGAPMAPPEGEDDERRYVEPWGPVAPLKRWGEVVVVGHAHAPEGNPVRSLVARLAVGDLDKAVQIRGAAGFTRRPAGFGPLRPEWPGRAQRLRRHAAGWDHARWVERPLPEDIDAAYFNVAPPDQVTEELTGAERIVLEHLHPRFARLVTRLCAPAPRAFTATYGIEQRVPLRCDTLVIDADRGVAALVWRGQLLLDHPQREGVVVVTHDDAAPSSTGTMAPPLSSRSAAALPFQRASAPASAGLPAGAAPDASGAPDANGARVPPSPGASRPVEDEDNAQTQAPALEPARAALPFHAGGPSPLDDAPEGGPFTLRRATDPPGPPPSPPRAGDTAPPPSLAGDTASPSLTASDALHPDAPPAWRFSTAPPPPAPSAPPLLATPAPPPPLATPTPPPLATPAPPPLATPAPPPLATPAQRRVAEPAPADEPAPAAVAVEKLPAGPGAAPALPVGEYPLARCAAIAARLARTPESRGAILEAEALAPDTWEALHAHWLDAIRAGTARGSKALLSAYDAAYVGALEAERGPITAGEYARLVIAVERGTDKEALADLKLPEGVMIRLRRVWLERIVRDPQAAQEVRKAMREAGQAS